MSRLGSVLEVLLFRIGVKKTVVNWWTHSISNSQQGTPNNQGKIRLYMRNFRCGGNSSGKCQVAREREFMLPEAISAHSQSHTPIPPHSHTPAGVNCFSVGCCALNTLIDSDLSRRRDEFRTCPAFRGVSIFMLRFCFGFRYSCFDIHVLLLRGFFCPGEWILSVGCWIFRQNSPGIQYHAFGTWFAERRLSRKHWSI